MYNIVFLRFDFLSRRTINIYLCLIKGAIPIQLSLFAGNTRNSKDQVYVPDV